MRVFIERVSTFSLNISVIGPSNPDEPRGKVAPHCKSYAWVPVLLSFDNSGGEGGGGGGGGGW